MGGTLLKLVSKNGSDSLSTKHSTLASITAESIDGVSASLGDLTNGKKCTLVVNVATK